MARLSEIFPSRALAAPTTPSLPIIAASTISPVDRPVRRDDVDALIDQLAGITLTHLSGMAARCSRDMVVRRNIDAVVMQVRREISEACSKAADECGEPPLDEQ